MNIPGKLLLFGEYAVLRGGNALAVPLSDYYGTLTFEEGVDKASSNAVLQNFLPYLNQISNQLQIIKLDLRAIAANVQKGLWFRSNIPFKSGLGSSGALVAAIAIKYGSYDRKPLGLLKNDLALMESFFHGSSSGIDPLVSYINKPIYIKQNDVLSVKIESKESLPLLIPITGTGDTGSLVNHFLSQLENEEYKALFDHDYLPLQNTLVDYFLKKDIDYWEDDLLKLSAMQLNLFKDMIPQSIIAAWKNGLSSKDYALKLCGSGGGGFALGFAFNNEGRKKLTQLLS